MDKLQKRYFDEFKKAHWGIKPIDWEEIAEFCQQKGIAETKINYNTARKLATNVC